MIKSHVLSQLSYNRIYKKVEYLVANPFIILSLPLNQIRFIVLRLTISINLTIKGFYVFIKANVRLLCGDRGVLDHVYPTIYIPHIGQRLNSLTARSLPYIIAVSLITGAYGLLVWSFATGNPFSHQLRQSANTYSTTTHLLNKSLEHYCKHLKLWDIAL